MNQKGKVSYFNNEGAFIIYGEGRGGGYEVILNFNVIFWWLPTIVIIVLLII